jgi:hypothetical protein
MIPYVDNDTEILFNPAICFYWSACTKSGKLAVMFICWGNRFWLCFYDFSMYEVDVAHSSGILDLKITGIDVINKITKRIELLSGRISFW